MERRNGFYETSFMPGRDFRSPADFDAQFTEWLTKANTRLVRTIKARPVDLLDADKVSGYYLTCRSAYGLTCGTVS